MANGTTAPSTVETLPEADLGTDAANEEADALFREAKRRERRRRLGLLGALIAIAGAVLAGYGLESKGARAPHPGSLLARPLHFPTLATGEACPATPGRPIINSLFTGTALGSGPVRVLVANAGNLLRGRPDLGTTQVPGWFTLQTVWFATQGYDGPFVVRAKRLDGTGAVEVQPGRSGLQPGSGPLVVPAGPTLNTQDGYRTVPGSTWVTSPGCYGWQVDGRNFRQMIVVDALHQP